MFNLAGKKWLGIPIVLLVLVIGLGTGGVALAETVFYTAHVNLSVIDGLAINYDNTTDWDTATDTWSPPAVHPGEAVHTSLSIFNNGDTDVPVIVDTVNHPTPEISFTVEWEDSKGGSGDTGFIVPARDGTPGWVHLDITLAASEACPVGDYDLGLSFSRT